MQKINKMYKKTLFLTGKCSQVVNVWKLNNKMNTTCCHTCLANQRNYFENATACSKRKLKQHITTRIYLAIFDHVRRLILLSVIHLSGGNCNWRNKEVKERKKEQIKTLKILDEALFECPIKQTLFESAKYGYDKICFIAHRNW